MKWNGEIRPSTADLEQVLMGADGQFIHIDAEVNEIAAQLKALDSRLHVRYSESGGYFVIYSREEHEPEGTGHAILYPEELDGRVVKEIERVLWKNRQPGYSYAAELEEKEAADKKQRDYEFSEALGESAERLAHALRKDLNMDKHRIVVPGE